MKTKEIPGANRSDTHHIIHPIPPFYDKDSEILILGSFPSVKSREQMFFYGHPQNRFWKVIAQVFEDEEPVTVVSGNEIMMVKTKDGTYLFG